MQVLDMQHQEEVSGGVTWGQVGVGLAMLSLAVSIAATGGLSGIAIGVIAGAGVGADLAVAGAAIGLSGVGGFTVGLGTRQ